MSRFGPPPKCDLCGTNHHSHQAHVFRTAVSRVASDVDAINAPRAERVSQSEPKLASTTYLHRDEEKRREYQRLLMRQRRAAGRVS